MIKPEEQCTQRVGFRERWDYQGHRCSRRAKFDVENGKPTKCRQHSSFEKRTRRTRARERREAAYLASPAGELKALRDSVKDALEALEELKGQTASTFVGDELEHAIALLKENL